MTDIIVLLAIVLILILVVVVFSVLRISELKRRRTLGRSLSKRGWFDKQLMKLFAKDFPSDK